MENNAESIGQALIELEKVDVDSLPEHLRDIVIHIHMSLNAVSDELEPI